MQMQRWIGRGAAVVVLAALGMGAAASEFSADMRSSAAGVETTGRLYVKGDRMRIEQEAMGQRSVMIIDTAAHVTWMIQEDMGMYMEIAGMEAEHGAAVPEPDAERVDLGTEEVNGYLCDKMEFRLPGDDSVMTQWVARDLNYPIRQVYSGPEGQMVTEYSNIREGGVADTLMQVPKGYQKMSIPGMGGMGGVPGLTQ